MQGRAAKEGWCTQGHGRPRAAEACSVPQPSLGRKSRGRGPLAVWAAASVRKEKGKEGGRTASTNKMCTLGMLKSILRAFRTSPGVEYKPETGVRQVKVRECAKHCEAVDSISDARRVSRVLGRVLGVLCVLEGASMILSSMATFSFAFRY
jgi:hypothetical protein